MKKLTIFLLLPFSVGQTYAQQPETVKGLRFRPIGPYRGGRVTAVSGVVGQPNVYYFGATGGGVWRTTDSGVNWEPISDDKFGTGSVGAIAVAESDPNVIYVGMGESPVRGNVSHGDGVYKSTDAGKTWKRVGLEDTRHIGRVRVHPRNPDIVYVAALGHIFGANEQRGVFRSTDGGKNWQKVLYRNATAGAIDLILDPANPNNIYAGFWQVKRTPYSLESGGPGSGLFKSTDGGDTWSEITNNPGLPKGMIGKVGVTVSRVNPERVWAIVEAEQGGVFRSENGGKSWQKVNEDRRLRQRAWYYTRIYADPVNADTVYVLNVGFHKSNDGGRTFTSISVPHGDNHDLWIAPDDASRMVEGNDGGANVSNNGGRTWTELDQATAQFYRVAVDNDFPYNIYGAQQDNSTVRIPSRTVEFGIGRSDWYDVGGGESGWIAPNPKNTNIVYAGSYGGLITRYDHRTGETRDVTVWPDNPMGAGAEAMRYRFQWNFPIIYSRHEDAIYAGGNILFKSTDEGQSWQAVSPDLTRNDRSKQGSSGGPITKDNTSVEYYCTIFSLAESPLQAGVMWAGSDDGLVHVTRDGGKNWENVAPKGIPEFIQINSVEASPYEAGAAYIAATMYKWDDFRPYLYKTSDYGKTWVKITDGIGESAFTRVVRADPNHKGILYAGTETGLYISYDDGKRWQKFQLNLPVVPITDLAVHAREKDLVVATQGRSFWILDDLPILHQMSGEAEKADVRLYKPEDPYRMRGFGGPLPARVTVGENPPNGTLIYYHLKNKPAGEVVIEFFDKSGKLVNKFTNKAPEGQPQQEMPADDSEFAFARPGRVMAEAGLNRFVWDMRYGEATRFPNLILWAGSTAGPRIVPGAYQVKLTVDGKSYTENFEVKKDPRVSAGADDFDKQYELLMKIRDKLTETHEAIIQIRDVRRQIDDMAARMKDRAEAKPVLEAAKSLRERLTAIEETLYQTKNQSNQDPLNFPIRLNNKLAALAGVVASADRAPTSQSYAVYDDLVGKIDAQLQKLGQVMSTDLPAFNTLVRETNVPAVIIKKNAKESR